MPKINFETKLTKIGSWIIVVLPKSASIKLPSRGLTLVQGTINWTNFKTTLEPDGRGSHWFRIDNILQKAAHISSKEIVNLTIESTGDWPEPEVPNDLNIALKANPKAQKTWKDITPMARWDWIRWVNSTKNPQTRKKRIKTTFSKFRSGIRRPCCFNRTECTVPAVSNGGVLLALNG